MSGTSRNFAAGALAAGALVAVSTVMRLAPASADNSTIRLIARGTAINNFVDVDPAGLSPGDIYVFDDNMFNLSGSRVGHAEGRCNLINPSAPPRFECTIVSTITAEGTLTTDGILVNDPAAPPSVGAITGGTGKYRNAAGEGHAQARRSSGTPRDYVRAFPVTSQQLSGRRRSAGHFVRSVTRRFTPDASVSPPD